MRFARSVAALICAIIIGGCGSGGLLNLNPQPDGNIVITNATTGATLSTTLATPFSVSGGAFSIGITESHFSGPYTISISTWTAPFNESCFVAHYVDQTNKTNVVKFSADNAAPVTAPTQPSPCNPFVGTNGTTQTDEETAQITDGHGHTATFFYKIAGATTGGGGSGSPTAVKLAVSWSGPSPTNTACGAYVLNVGAVSASGTAVTTSAANPITLSTTGGGYMGFSTATSAAAGFTCPQGTGSPGGSPSIQLTTSPSQVLVYFNGFSAAATTTITANSVGFSPVTIAITNSAPGAAKLVTSWSGPSPTGTACGAYVLNVGAVDASGASIATTAANPITLSTTGGAYMGFSAATSAAGFTCPQSSGTPPVGSPGGTATLQLTSSPTQVLVYFNGFSAAATTTITANSVGISPVSVAISNTTTTTVASIVLKWNNLNDQPPTLGNCGAFILNVEAFDANGTQIVSSTYRNPITISTNNGYWSGFSTVVAGISPAPVPAALICRPPPPQAPSVGTSTLAVPDTATPTVVYYDGISTYGATAGATTITATAVGVPASPNGTNTKTF